MGNKETQPERIMALIAQMSAKVGSKQYFELGDDPAILTELRGITAEINKILIALSTSFLDENLQESNKIYDSIKITHDIEDFLKYDCRKGGGSEQKTERFLEFIKTLEDKLGTFPLFKTSKAGKQETTSGSKFPARKIRQQQKNIESKNNEAIKSANNTTIVIQGDFTGNLINGDTNKLNTTQDKS